MSVIKRLFFSLTLLLLSLTEAQAQWFTNLQHNDSSAYCPKRETRAVWLTTIGGLDWPHGYAQTPSSIERQKQQLRDILDKLQAVNINTVLLQTRIRGTVIYPSDMEPWDGCLSGFPGKSPGYDALQFAIDECHRRGMRLETWIVCIPVGHPNQAGVKNLRRRFSGRIKTIDNECYMDPEDPRTGDYLARLCREIVSRYDVDGINLDYIRYPETWKIRNNHDEARGYITSIVRKIHDAVTAVKPWVTLSCSPIGKADDLSRFWSHGWNAYDRVCQDATGWLHEGIMDNLYPMMYFRDNNFYPFAIDWKEQARGKDIAAGLGIYFLDPKEGSWQIGNVTRELYMLRRLGLGQAFFRTKFLLDNVQGIYDFLRTFNAYPALPLTRRLTYNIYVGNDTTDDRNLIAVNIPKEQMERIRENLGNAYDYVITENDAAGKERIYAENTGSGKNFEKIRRKIWQCQK